ncbi:MAG: hypothetical protein ACO1O1_07780 [Adhaeribacter sp.]
MIDLKHVWEELACRYTGNLSLAHGLWSEIHHQYTARKRHYHNLRHLAYMAGLALEYEKLLDDPDTLLFSIFYHDIIYRIKSAENEQKSAAVALEKLTKLGFPPAKVARCAQQILATKSHGFSLDPDTNFLLDFDLAILGESPDVYHDYARKIRAEYALYPDFLYNTGRKKVLQHFLEMEHIFKTGPFLGKYEQQARINLQNELTVL